MAKEPREDVKELARREFDLSMPSSGPLTINVSHPDTNTRFKVDLTYLPSCDAFRVEGFYDYSRGGGGRK